MERLSRFAIWFILTVGFRLVRQVGSHHVYKHPQISGALNLQPIGRMRRNTKRGKPWTCWYQIDQANDHEQVPDHRFLVGGRQRLDR
jgi:hypothetical protein